jgi:hypothetical protein
MKRILLYLLSLMLAFISGCGPKSEAPIPVGGPEGTFAGQFQLLHLHSKTGVIDTLTANIILQMEQSTGFKVTGDTSTVHAGSYGSFIVSVPYSNVDFIDKTYPTTGTPAKIHLNGVYSYNYDGTNLQLVAYSAFDTLSYYYNLKRTGN